MDEGNLSNRKPGLLLCLSSLFGGGEEVRAMGVSSSLLPSQEIQVKKACMVVNI